MSTAPETDGGPSQRRRLFRRRQRPATPESLHGLGWGDVLKHAWRHIKNSGRVVLGGFVVSAVLPPLYQWWDTYHWSHTGLDEVTGGGWESSLIGVGAWLVVVTVWHLARASIGHAREVLSVRERHHAPEIERMREAAKSEAPPSIGQYVHNQIIVTSPEEAAELTGERNQYETIEVGEPPPVPPLSPLATSTASPLTHPDPRAMRVYHAAVRRHLARRKRRPPGEP